MSDGTNVGLVTQFNYTLSTILFPTILGTESAGLSILQGNTWSSVFPAGPPSTRFIGIAVDQRGVVWSGTGKSNGFGFMSFDGKKWRLYNKQQYPEFRYDDFYKVSVSLNNSKWIIGWGPGVVLVDDTGKVVQTYNTKNGIPWSIDHDKRYAVVTGAAVDQNGVTWITSRTPPGDTILIKYEQDGTFDYLTGYIFSNNNMQNPLNYFTDVVIDDYGTKWFGNFTRFEPKQTIGFFYYNEHYALPNTVGGWGKLTLSPDNVRCLVVDKEGSLWTGSDKGITIIFNTTNPQTSIATYHPLQDQVIQSIVVDAVNNKWVATQQGGVFVLSPDGTSIVERYTVENTNGRLLDDDINSIAIDGNAGTIYFGTEKGLSSLTTTMVVNPKQSFKEITFFPNPFYLPSSKVGSKCPDQVLIGGLVRNSSIKILTAGASLVREIQTAGSGEECWDGKDEKGNYVASGIYIVVAFSEDGEQVSKGKIAIIRK
jgi:sugar lactone lactonase YvrE